MLLPHGTVIAIIDGKDWALFRNAGTEAEPELAALETPALVESNHGGAGPDDSPRQMNESAHVAAVAAYLNREVTAHKIEQLVVIAPPRALGELRQHWSPQLKQALAGELAKELIGRQPDELLAALRANA